MKLKLIIYIILVPLFLLIYAESAELYASDEASDENIQLPVVNSLVLDNGLRIFYIKDELPRYTISVSVGFGKLYETESNAGISDLLANTISLSGSEKYPGNKLHDAIEKIGGRFNVSSSWEDTSITLQVLDRYYDLALDIIDDILKNPEINPAMIEKARLLLLEDIRRKQDSPELLAFEKARNVIYNGNGYGAVQTEESVKSLSAKDLKNVISKYFSAENIIVGISGPVKFETVKQSLKKSFSRLKKGNCIDYSIDDKSILKELPEKSNNIYFIEKNIPQATIVIGTIAPDIKDKNIYTLTLMDNILGGGSFTSRLMQEIRVKRGLAYSVQSVIRFRKKTGVFLAFAQTNTESADKTLKLLKENIKGMSVAEVESKELKLAKDSIRNSYVFEFATPADILNQYIFINYNGLSESYLKNYVKSIDTVDRGDIRRSAQNLIKNGLITVVVGDKSLVGKLNKFGKVVLCK